MEDNINTNIDTTNNTSKDTNKKIVNNVEIKSASEFLNLIFDKNDKFFISTIHEERGWTNNYYTKLSSLGSMLSACERKNSENHIYYSVSTYIPNEEEKKNYKNEYQWINNSRRKSNVKEIKLIFFDFDEVDKVERQLSDVRELLGEPSAIIESSPNKRQVIYKLEKPVKSENKEDFENLMYILNDKIGSDVAVKTVQQILRLPFFKNIKKKYCVDGEFPTSRIISSTDNKISYENLVETYKNDMENINQLKLEKSKNRSRLSKSIDNSIDMYEKRDIDESHMEKYNSILTTTKSFKSTDLRYTNHRSNEENDFMVIFNEIIAFRNKLNNPFSNTTMNTDIKLRNHFNTLLNIYIDNREKKQLDVTSYLNLIKNDNLSSNISNTNNVEIKQKSVSRQVIEFLRENDDVSKNIVDIKSLSPIEKSKYLYPTPFD